MQTFFCPSAFRETFPVFLCAQKRTVLFQRRCAYPTLKTICQFSYFASINARWLLSVISTTT